MAEAKKDDRKPVYSKELLTPPGQLSWPKIDQPVGPDEYHSKPTWETDIIFTRGFDKDNARVKAMRAEVLRISKEFWGPKVNMKEVLMPWKKGDEKGDQYVGHMFMKAKTTKAAPAVVGTDKLPLPPNSTLYGGVKAILSVTFATYEMPRKDRDGTKWVEKGITTYLQIVVKVGDAAPFGGGSSDPKDLPDDLDEEADWEDENAPVAEEDEADWDTDDKDTDDIPF